MSPPAVAVSGSDWFEVMVDQRMRGKLGHGHVSHLVVDLEDRLDLEAAAALVERGPWPELSRVRLVSQGLARPAAWALAGDSAPLERVVLPPERSFDAWLASVDAPALGQPLRLLLVAQGPRSALVLSWCHAVADARSAEALLLAIAAGQGATGLPEGGPPAPLTDRLRAAKKARDQVLRTSLGRFATFRGSPSGPAHHARRLVDPAALRQQAARLGAGPLVGAFFVGASAHAVRRLRTRLGMPHLDHLVPVPVDRRRRGGASPLLGNRLGVMMHRLPSARLDSLEEAVGCATSSARELMRDDFVASFDGLWDLCRWLPLDLYAAIVGGPTLGRLASYGCSYLRSGLDELREVAGVPVRSAHHVPSNHAPPGLTLVAMERAGGVELDVAWYPGALADEHGVALADDLAALLAGAC